MIDTPQPRHMQLQWQLHGYESNHHDAIKCLNTEMTGERLSLSLFNYGYDAVMYLPLPLALPRCISAL